MNRFARRGISYLLTSLILFWWLGPSPISGAQGDPSRGTVEIEVEDHPTCPSCKIEIRKLVLLDASADPISPLTRSSVIRDLEGSFWVEPSFPPGSIIHYGPDGKFVRAFGNEGKSPGEYSTYLLKTLQLDGRGNLLVFDPGNERVTTLSPHGELLGTGEIPAASKYLKLENGILVFSGGWSSWETRQTAGEPLHSISTRGQLRSFGNPDHQPVIRGSREWVRNLSGAPDGNFWATHVSRYVAELWTPEGQLLRRISGSPDWFPPDQREGKFGEDPPVPIFRNVVQREDGLLLCLMYVPDPGWRSAPERDEHGHLSLNSASSINGYWDTVIQLVNPNSGRLLAEERVDPHLRGFADPGHLFSFTGDDRDHVFIQIWSLKTSSYP